jgi:hypothetical protein
VSRTVIRRHPAPNSARVSTPGRRLHQHSASPPSASPGLTHDRAAR